MLSENPGTVVNLPHDGMIGTPVTPDAPFYLDLTPYVIFGEENRITVNLNTASQPNSRWYTGSGLFRGVKLCHGPRVHIVTSLCGSSFRLFKGE